jgi:hypothetical protein
VVMLVPEFLQLDESSGLSRSEDFRNAVCVDGVSRAGFQSQVGSNAATVTLELNEPAVVVVAFSK